MDGQDDRFAAPGAKPPQDSFGFFSGPAPAAPVPAATPPVAPPGPPLAQGQYGPPPVPAYGAPAAPFGTPSNVPSYGAPTAPAGGIGRGKQLGAAVLAVAIVIAGGTFGWAQWQQHQDIGVPATLGGFAQDQEPAAAAAVSASLNSLKQKNPGKKAIAMAYGDAHTNLVILVGIRGHLTSFAKDFEEGGAVGPQQHIGHNTCAAAFVGFVCERTSGHLTEGVFAISKTGTIAQASSLLDEAWKRA